MEKTTYRIGDKITYSDDAEMAKDLGLTPLTFTGTIKAIHSNGEQVQETTDEFAILVTEHDSSAIAKYAAKVA